MIWKTVCWVYNSTFSCFVFENALVAPKIFFGVWLMSSFKWKPLLLKMKLFRTIIQTIWHLGSTTINVANLFCPDSVVVNVRCYITGAFLVSSETTVFQNYRNKEFKALNTQFYDKELKQHRTMSCQSVNHTTVNFQNHYKCKYVIKCCIWLSDLFAIAFAW